MKKDTDRITDLIWNAIDDVNALLPADARITRREDAVLLGAAGGLDSFGLVNLVVALEQQIEDEFGVTLTLADERAMSHRRSPFRSVNTLRDYVAELLNQTPHA